MSNVERVILLIDLDCFYCQVEENLDLRLKGKSLAVLQYNVWREGGIIAANYAARKFGVNKGMWRKEAEEKCPGIQFARVPELRGKADLTRYREAGKKVADVLQSFTDFLERASIDESYLDVTDLVSKHMNSCLSKITLSDIPNTRIVGHDTSDFLDYIYDNREVSSDDLKLIVGALICEQIRAKVFTETGYECSAGIAHNKLLAKLASSVHKPNKQTVLPRSSIEDFLKNFPIRKMKNLGGKLGKTLLEEFSVSVVGELVKFSEKELTKKFDEKTGKWLYNIARGIDSTPVNKHFLTNSIACSKQFPGKNSLTSLHLIEHWVKEIALDLYERLQKDFEENCRKGKQMTVSCSIEINGKDHSHSKTLPLVIYDSNKIAQKAMDAVKLIIMKRGIICVKLLSMNVHNFESTKNVLSIKSLFNNINNSDSGKSGSEILENENSTPKLRKLSNGKPQEMKAPSDSKNSDEEKSQAAENKTTVNDSCFGNRNISEICNIQDKMTTKSHLENERVSKNTNDNTTSRGMQYSFFMSYFEKRAIQQSKVGSTEDQVLPDSNDCDSGHINCDYPYISGNDSTTNKVVIDNILKTEKAEVISSGINDTGINNSNKICPECNETVLESEYYVHMDYHYALKLTIGDSAIQKKIDNSKPLENIELSRQSPNIVKEPGTLKTFLQKEPLSPESEFCIQCKKKIKISDLDNHIDYHTAKKLQAEINTLSRQPSKKMRKSKNNVNIRKISSFFKPL